mmetsp:Transcript_7517/g.22897  ORF Transcript_7517/g.22897 Transcript_7517/m.22897 type:complete len:252 (-) Transcript_7517:209-964(-)
MHRAPGQQGQRLEAAPGGDRDAGLPGAARPQDPGRGAHEPRRCRDEDGADLPGPRMRGRRGGRDPVPVLHCGRHPFPACCGQGKGRTHRQGAAGPALPAGGRGSAAAAAPALHGGDHQGGPRQRRRRRLGRAPGDRRSGGREAAAGRPACATAAADAGVHATRGRLWLAAAHRGALGRGARGRRRRPPPGAGGDGSALHRAAGEACADTGSGRFGPQQTDSAALPGDLRCASAQAGRSAVSPGQGGHLQVV